MVIKNKLKKYTTYGMVGTMFLYNCIFPTEPTSIEKNTTSITINEETKEVVPKSIEDLVLNLTLSSKFESNSPINYTAKNKNQSGGEIKLDNSLEKDANGNYVPNGEHKKAFEFQIIRDGEIVKSERNSSDLTIWLKDKGYIEQEARNDTLITSICSAKVDYWKSFYDVPYPLKVKKTNITTPITLEDGKYYFRIPVTYSKKDTIYQSTFVSDDFEVGTSTGIKDYLYKQGKKIAKDMIYKEIKKLPTRILKKEVVGVRR
jgi:hypothetical protein